MLLSVPVLLRLLRQQSCAQGCPTSLPGHVVVMYRTGDFALSWLRRMVTRLRSEGEA